MNILFISSIFPDTLSPARGTFNYEMCCALQRADADVRIIAPRAWPEVMRQRFTGKVAGPTEGMLKHRLTVSYPTYWYPPKVARSCYGGFYWRSIRNTFHSLTQQWKPDLVLSYWAHPDGSAGLQAGQEAGSRTAVIVGGSDVLLLPTSASRKRQVVKVLTQSDAVFTVSSGLAEVVCELGTEPARSIPVYQGVDSARFKIGNTTTARKWLGLDPDRPLLIWVGRMVAVKNLDMLISAAEIKADRGDDFVMCLLGDGPERDRLERTVRERGLDDIISFVGSVGHADLPAWYQAADATVLCSHSEGLPNVFRESLACGTPFVSTDVGSISEIADPTFSELVEPGDARALATAIDKVINGPHQVHAEQTEVRTWDHMAADILEISKDLQPVSSTSTN